LDFLSVSVSTGFGQAQVFPKNNQLEIAFCDAGVGIRQSLQRNFEYAGRLDDDGAALEAAVRQGVTCTPSGGEVDGHYNSGIGLYQFVNLADTLGGEARLYSGSACLIRKGGETKTRPSPHWDGVLAVLRVPTPAHSISPFESL